MKIKILYLLLLIVPCTMVFRCNCGSDTVTPPTNNDCGPHHSQRYPASGEINMGDYTNTFIEGSNTRVFQYSAIPFTTIDGLCTKSKPSATGNASYSQGDTGRPLSVYLKVLVSAGLQPYSDAGEYHFPGATSITWDGLISVGLQQAYGEGPGSILDLRVEAKFRTTGNFTTDSLILALRAFTCNMNLAYDEYRATDAGAGWLQPVFPGEQVSHHFSDSQRESIVNNIINGKYLISENRKVSFKKD